MAAKEYSIAFSLAAHLNGKFAQTFQGASQYVNQFNSQLGKLGNDLSQYDRLIKLRKEVALVARSNIHARESVARLGKQMSATKNPSQELTEAFAKATIKLDKTKKALEKKREALRQLDNEMGTSGVHLKDLIRKEGDLKRAIDQVAQAQQRRLSVQNRLNKLSERQKKFRERGLMSAASITGMVATVNATMVKPINQAMQMEDAMADIAKVVNFDEPNGLVKMQEALEDMSLRIPMTASGLAQIAAAAGQAGVPTRELLEFTEQAAKMGVAYDITAQEAGDMMAKWRSGMGLTQEQVNRLADATNALSNSNAAQARQIGETLKRYGALGKVVGLTELQTAAMAATVIASGAEAEVAATGINAFMRALSRGSSMSTTQALAFSKVGFDPKQLQKDLLQNAPETIMKVLNQIKNRVPKELQMEYLTAMFGDEGARAMGPMLTNTELLAKNFAMVADGASFADSMLKEFESRSATTSNAVTLMSNAVDLATRALGNPFLGVIKENCKYFIRAAAGIGHWIAQNSELVFTLSTIAATVLGTITAFHIGRLALWLFGSPIVALVKGFIALRNSQLAATVATKAWTLATTVGAKLATAFTVGVKALGVALRFAFLNPVGLAITAIAGLVAAGVALYKNWDIVKAKALSVWTGIKDAAKGPINTVIGWINKLISAINSIKLPSFLGGKGLNISPVPQLANGGIATGASLAMVGEGREPEAILPLSHLSSMLGRSVSGASSVSVNFAPVINISGTSSNVYDDVQRGLRAGSSDLKRELERLLSDQRRLAY